MEVALPHEMLTLLTLRTHIDRRLECYDNMVICGRKGGRGVLELTQDFQNTTFTFLNHKFLGGTLDKSILKV